VLKIRHLLKQLQEFKGNLESDNALPGEIACCLFEWATRLNDG